MARRYSLSRIKSNRSFEIEEAAEVLGVTSQTVREWIKEGLPALTEKRPFLILGWQLRAWLGSRESKRARPLRDGEFYCVRCKARRRAAQGLTERGETADGRTVLRGFCEVCETLCHRFLPAN